MDRNGESNQILNNRPPDLRNDFGIRDEEDHLDERLMPDQTASEDPRHTNKNKD